MFPHYNDTMNIVYYEDIKLHAKYRSKPYLLTEQTIVEFAQQWDPAPLHVDAEFAKASSFGALIAPAALLLAIRMKLVREQKPKVAYRVGLGWNDVKLLAPARPGDTIMWEEELLQARIEVRLNCWHLKFYSSTAQSTRRTDSDLLGVCIGGETPAKKLHISCRRITQNMHSQPLKGLL